jgi:hypothetical protein
MAMSFHRSGDLARRARHHGRLVLGILALAATMTGLTTTDAWAGPPTSVTGVTAALTSAAAGAQVNWTVGFTTSASGALAGSGSNVTVVLPAGASLGPSGPDTLTDTTSGQGLANDCGNVTSTEVTCQLNFGNPVAAGDVLSVALFAVTNPTATGPATVSASTSSDTQHGTTSVTITAAQAVTGVTASETSTAAGAQVAWRVEFSPSSTGILQGTANSFITVTLPAGTTFGHYGTALVTDITTGNNLSYYCGVSTGTSLICDIFLGQTVSGGDVVLVTLNVVTNPTTTGSGTVSVSTSSDTATPATSTATPITADQPVTGLSEALVSTAASAETTSTTTFTTSSTGAMELAADSTVAVTLPTGTTFGSFVFSIVTDTTTAQTVALGTCSVTSGTTVSCLIQGPVHAGDTVTVLLRGVINPSAAGSATVAVTTTSDLTSATTPVTITPAQSVTGLTVTPSSAGAGLTSNWTFAFHSSSTGAFGAYDGYVTLNLPAGTTFGSFTGGRVVDNTIGQEVDNCSITGTTVKCLAAFSSNNVHAGDSFSVILNGVTNTLTTGPVPVSLSTSSDTKKATTSVTITGVTCAKVSGKLAGSISFKKCTPKSPTNKSAKGPGASLTSSGTLTWKKSHQTTVISASAPASSGQGGCKHGSTERDVTGSVTGGTSTYTKSGDYVSARLCVSGSGSVSLVKGTKALM